MRSFAEDLTATRTLRRTGIDGCLCGCPLPRRPRSVYGSDACRTRYWKRSTNYVFRRPQNARNAAQNGRSRSGRQLSYRKTRQALLARLWHFPGAERLIDEALEAALPVRQRKGPE